MSIFIYILILLGLFYYNKEVEHFDTYSIPPGTDPATAKAIGAAQSVGAQMCDNSDLDHINEKSKKKHNTCGE